MKKLDIRSAKAGRLDHILAVIEGLTSLPDCENSDDKDAEKIIQSLYELSLLSYDILY